MPKRHQQRPAKELAGRNNPKKSTTITTGTYKKSETSREQALEHENPTITPQEAKVPPSIDFSEGRSHKADSRLMTEEGEKRSGSASNANKHRKGSKLHEQAQKQPQPHHQQNKDFIDDLRPDNLAGENHGPQELSREFGLSAYDVKDLHTKLADLTDDELKNIVIVPVGTSLEQGAKYIDLQHLEQGEFVAMANMLADENHYYVPKKETDYLIWNRLNQVTNPARLDEFEAPG